MRRPIGLSDSAFLRLFDGSAEIILRYFLRRTLAAEVAADLTAETFARAFVSRGAFDQTKGTPQEWLHGIASHVFAQYWRFKTVETRTLETLGMTSPTLEQQDYDRVEELIDLAAIAEPVAAAMQALPSDQRNAVELRIIEELSYQDVARRLECSEEVARARVSRGLRALAEKLGSGARPRLAG